MKSLLVGILLFGFVASANAAFTDNGTYLSDSSSNLDWLDLTASVNRSYNDVSSQFGIGGDFEGWRYATTLEFETLISNWFSISFNSYADTDIDLTFLLIATLGNTAWSTAGEENQMDIMGIVADVFFGEPGRPEHYWNYIFCDDRGSALGNGCYASSLYANGYDSEADSRLGSFLVRRSVPEASSLVLLSLGLLGLFGVARKRTV